jgi:tetratricopeptide (TPR) repeat protein
MFLDPQNYDAAVGRAGALKAMGRKNEAVQAYGEALKLRPGDLVGNQELAVILAEMGRLPEAADAFRTAVRFNPGSVTALNNLGRAYWMQGEREQARAAFLKALEIDPSNDFAQRALKALGARGRP